MNRIGFYASVLIAGTFLAALPPALANEWEIPRTGQKNQSKDFCGRSSCVRRRLTAASSCAGGCSRCRKSAA